MTGKIASSSTELQQQHVVEACGCWGALLSKATGGISTITTYGVIIQLSPD